MVDKIICPQCQFENQANASECKNCGNDLSHLISNDQPDPDWLSFLRDAEDEERRNTDNQENNLFNSASDFSDESSNEGLNWLERINAKKENEKSEPSNGSTSKEDSLTNSTVPENKDQSNPPPQNWLTDFRNNSETSDNIDQSEDVADNLNLDWLENSSGESKPGETFSLEDLSKDWQKEFSEQIGLEDADGISPAEELPGWLNHNDNHEDEVDNDEEPDIPTWLNSSYNQLSNDAILDDQPSELPDWLSNSKLSANQEEQPQSKIEDNKDDIVGIPDWITEINQKMGGINPDEGSDEDKSDSENENPYDSRLLFNKLDLSPQISKDDPENADPIKKENSEPKDEEKHEFKGPAFILEPEEADNLPVKPFIDFNENENWDEEISKISALKAEEKFNPKDGANQQNTDTHSSPPPFTFGDIPSWMDDIDFDAQLFEELDQKTEGPKTTVSLPENLEKASLPEWLQAIRPVEVVTPKIQNNANKQVEKSGPLAGLHGVLSSEGVTKSYTKPPTYSVSINVTEKQKSHLQLLEEIINPAVTVTSGSKKKKSKFQSIENYLLPLFLILIILASLFIDHSNTKMPKTFPADAVRFYNLATGYLSRNANPSHVLAIFETDASSYPEINIISKGFFESLYENNHWVTTVATNPNGVLLAEEILSNAHVNVPSYNLEERVHNLGYLPGNIVGIQSFISNPRILSMGLDIKSDIWDEEPLSNINSFSDFDMIVILTDNSDQAKLWIEQMNLTVPDTSLLFISTAKASPLLQPYLETDQIDGVLSGIIGGLSYDLLSSKDTNEISRLWSINQLVVINFILFILAGGVISLFSKAASSNSIGGQN